MLNKTSGLSAGSVRGNVFLPDRLPAAGATVTVTSGDGGIVGTTDTNITGGYDVGNLGQGNYSIAASLGSSSLGSPPSSIDVTKPGATLHQNLSLTAIFTISLAVVGNGNPLPGFPVRFTPILPISPPAPANGTAGPPGGQGGPPGAPGSPGTSNSSVFFTDTNGFVTATLPVGNYSIYGLGYVGATLFAGFSAAYLPGSTNFLTLPPLFAVPASRLSGVLVGTTVGSVSLPTELFVFDARGDVVTGFANSTAHWSFELPPGTYSVLAVQGLTSAASALSASLVNVTVLGDTVLTLTLGPAVKVQTRLGFPINVGPLSVFPAAEAATHLTLEPLGASVTALSDSQGNVSFVVPAALAAGESYCLTVNAAGFVPYSTCNLSPSQLQGMPEVPLVLSPVPVNVSVVGLPTGTTLTLNLTGTSPSAQTTSVSGGTSFALTLRPGSYEITGWGRAASVGLYLPPSSVNLTVPLGSPGVTLVVKVLRQVGATGTLFLPPGLSASAVQVRLMSPAQNLTISGSTFEGRFLAAPGNYTIYGSAPGANLSYGSLGFVTISPSGTLSAPLSLTTPASRVFVNFTRASGFLLAANFTATVLGPGGLTVPMTVHLGQGETVLPSNVSYSFELDTTTLVPTGVGSVYQRFTASVGSTCVPHASTSYCDVPLAASSVLSAFSGRLVYPGYPSALSGTVRLVGPAPSLNATEVVVANGTFTTALAPGNYQLYATAGGAAAPVANLSEISVSAAPGPSVDITLVPTWTDYVTLTPPASGVLGPATIVVTAPGGLSLTFPGEPFLVALPLVLPVGVYSIGASAPSSPFGVATNATASETVALVSGNA
ncbi:MAG TPA: carboxypeptidase-like regulatory domain-containing protein, partial [Thermoplasmata archaeon]